MFDIAAQESNHGSVPCALQTRARVRACVYVRVCACVCVCACVRAWHSCAYVNRLDNIELRSRLHAFYRTHYHNHLDALTNYHVVLSMGRICVHMNITWIAYCKPLIVKADVLYTFQRNCFVWPFLSILLPLLSSIIIPFYTELSPVSSASETYAWPQQASSL